MYTESFNEINDEMFEKCHELQVVGVSTLNFE